MGRAKLVHKGWNIISQSSKEPAKEIEKSTMDNLLDIAKGKHRGES